jgi:hypothetical protein
MADRIIRIKITDIVDGEEALFDYNADTKVLSRVGDVNQPHEAILVTVVSDA